MVQFSEKVFAFYVAALATVFATLITVYSLWTHLRAGQQQQRRAASNSTSSASTTGSGSGSGSTIAASSSAAATSDEQLDEEMRTSTVRILILVPLYACESFFDLFFKHYPGGSVFREAYEVPHLRVCARDC
jgi:hypothetical protein